MQRASELPRSIKERLLRVRLHHFISQVEKGWTRSRQLLPRPPLLLRPSPSLKRRRFSEIPRHFEIRMKNLFNVGIFVGILGGLVVFCSDTSFGYPAPSKGDERSNDRDLDRKELVELEDRLTDAIVRDLVELIEDKLTEAKNKIPGENNDLTKRTLCGPRFGYLHFCGKKR